MTNHEGFTNVATVRVLLLAAFTPETLRRFCLDRPLFQPAVVEFSPGQSLSDMIDGLIDFCRTKLLWDELLAAVEEENPRQYERFRSRLTGMAGLEQEATAAWRDSIGHAPISGGIEHASSEVIQTYLTAKPIGLIWAQSGLVSGLAIIITAQMRRVLFGRTSGLEGYAHVDHKVVIEKDPCIARNHCGIWVSPAEGEGSQARSYEFMVEDLDSSNGTFVNRNLIPPRRPWRLHSGDLIQIGGSEFVVYVF